MAGVESALSTSGGAQRYSRDLLAEAELIRAIEQEAAGLAVPGLVAAPEAGPDRSVRAGYGQVDDARALLAILPGSSTSPGSGGGAVEHNAASGGVGVLPQVAAGGPLAVLESAVAEAGRGVLACREFVEHWQGLQDRPGKRHLVLGKRVGKGEYRKLLRQAERAIGSQFSVFEVALAVARCNVTVEDYIASLRAIRDDKAVPPAARMKAADKIVNAPLVLLQRIRKMGEALDLEERQPGEQQVSGPRPAAAPAGPDVSEVLADLHGAVGEPESTPSPAVSRESPGQPAQSALAPADTGVMPPGVGQSTEGAELKEPEDF